MINGCDKVFYCRNLEISNDQVKFAAKYIKANFIACEILIKRVFIFL